MAEGGLGTDSNYLLNPDDYPDQIAAYTAYISDTAKQVRDYLRSSKTDADIEAEANDIVNYEISVANVRMITFFYSPF